MKRSVLALSVVVGMAFGAVAGIVAWEFPRTGNCHEGLPFSDSKTGVLVWGGGDTVNLTLGRSDMWDHRGGYAWTKEQNYTNILAAIATRDNKTLNTLFKNDPPENWGGRYNPYMLPLGRIVVKIPGRTLKSGILDTETGLGELVFADGGKMKLAMSTKRGVFAIAFPEGAGFEAKSVPATETSVYEKMLKNRGFEKAVVADGKTEGGFFWRLPVDVPAWVSWRRNGNELVVKTGRGERTDCAAVRFAEVEADSRAHWEKFWARSARVSVPDPVIQRIFDYGMYRFGAMTDPDGVPAGLQGPWLEDDKLVPWNGDYHFNINVQECYAPAYRGGHFDHLMPLFRMVLGWRERLRDNAKKFCGIDNGYILPHSVDDRGTCIGGFWAGTIDHGCTAWVADMMFRYVKYSGDVEFLKKDAYDFMKGAMNVYREMMVEDNGKLAIPMGPSPEWGGSWVEKAVGKNPSFQLAAAHRLARDLSAAAKMLGEKPDPMWADVMKRLPPYSADDHHGIHLFEGTVLSESHRHHSHMAALFPFDTLDLADAKTRHIARRTYDQWVGMGTGYWSGWCVPWAAILNVHMDAPERAVGLLRDWDTYYCDEGHGSHHNAVRKGFTCFINGRAVMQMDGQCAATAAVLELMAHETNGKVEFFKGCPDSWKEVSFTNIRLSDGSVVSGRRTNGKVVINGISGGEVAPADEIPFAKVGGHTHHMRKNGVTEAVADAALFKWAAEHELAAFGLGSPWTAANREQTIFNETTDRDRYFGGFKTNAWASLMDVEGNARKLAELNAKGGGTLYYLDNETPKSVFGHLWYIGFKQTVPSWHDYNQDRACWYSSYDDGKAERNALTGDPHKRRSYSDVVAGQRAHGALAIWAHPTSWWTKDGKNKGPFVTNIATDMIPQLMRDGFLDGMTVQGYDKYNRPYQELWFALLDLGYRVPGFSELDVSPSYGLDTKDSMLFNWIPYMTRPVTLDAIVRECRAAHHTMSSGPKLVLKVDGELQGAELESGAGRTHAVEVFAWPAKGEKTLSRVQLLGRGGRILAEKRDFAGGKISWKLAGDADGGYLIVRVFGEHDADYATKPQQQVKQCAITNPVWLRTDAFRAPKPIPAPDPLTIPEIRKLEDFLLKGEFRFDPRVTRELAPGEVPVWAFQIDKIRAALLRAAGTDAR